MAEERKYYPYDVVTSNGIVLSGDYMIANEDGIPLMAAYFDRARAKVRACACHFGVGTVNYGKKSFCSKGFDYETVYKPVNMGRDRFIYAFTYSKEIGNRYLISTAESLRRDFFHFIQNRYHVPILEEWIPYLLASAKANNYVYQVSSIKYFADPGRKIPLGGKMIPGSKLGIVDTSGLTEERLKELIQKGLQSKQIQITPNEQYPLQFDDFNGYIQKYGSALVSKLENELNPLIPLNGKVDSIAFKTKRLFPQQGACINGIKALRKAGSKYAFMTEGMGCGKTLQGAGVCDAYFNEKWLDAHPGSTLKDLYVDHMDEVVYRNIMMAPSHLVEKWKEEILSEIPGATVTVIEEFDQLLKLRSKGKTRTGREWYLISKDFCKLGSLLSPIPTNTTYSYPHLNYCRDCYEERNRLVPMVGAGKKESCNDCGGRRKISMPFTDYGKRYGMMCPSCNRLLIKYSPKWFKGSLDLPDEYVLKPKNFASKTTTNSICYNCGSQLWGVDVKPVDCGGYYSQYVKNRSPRWHKVTHFKNYAKKGTVSSFVLRGHEQEYLDSTYHEGLEDVQREYGPRKTAPALFIKKYLKGFFDFCILDECHKYENGGTAQTNAAHALIKASQFTLGLTGTLANGKADSLFYILYLLDPTKMKQAGFDYTDVMKFSRMYGSVETVYEVDSGGGAYNSCSRGRMLQAPRTVPGISPLLVTDFLLEKSVFLDLSDLSKYLPPLKEKVVLCKANDDLKSEYDYVIETLKKESHEKGGKGLMGTMLNFGLSYLDKPYGRKDIMSTVVKDAVVARVNNLDHYETDLLSKEEKLISIVKQEISEDRNVFLYACFTGDAETNVTSRLKDIIEEHCNLKGQVYILTAQNPSPKKRERFLKQKAKEGYRVIICNPKCVETGLDFCFYYENVWYNYPTLIFYQINYELSVIWQASRRAYRLIQKVECRNFYLAYEDTLQAAALEIMAEKQVATSALQGKFSVEGLSALAKGVDPRVKLAQMLAAGDNSSRESLENMFDVLNTQQDNDDDVYGDYEAPMTYYELIGVSQPSESNQTNTEITLFDLAFEETENVIKGVTEVVTETVTETVIHDKSNALGYSQMYVEVSLFDMFPEDIVEEKTIIIDEKKKKRKKKRQSLLGEQITLWDIAM